MVSSVDDVPGPSWKQNWRRPPPAERLLARLRLAPRRRGVALGRRSASTLGAGENVNAMVRAMRAMRLRRAETAPPAHSVDDSPGEEGFAGSTMRAAASACTGHGARAAGLKVPFGSPASGCTSALQVPTVRAGAVLRSSKVAGSVSWNRKARHQPSQRRDPRRAHRRPVGARRSVSGARDRRRAQPRPSTHQPARPRLLPCPCPSYRQFGQKALVGIIKVGHHAEPVDACRSGDPRRSSLSSSPRAPGEGGPWSPTRVYW